VPLLAKQSYLLVFTPAVSLEINFECHIYHVTLNNIKDVIGKKCVLPMHNYIVNIFINADVSYDNHLCCRKYYLKKTHVFILNVPHILCTIMYDVLTYLNT
jgi:hypothetical protein